MKFSIISVALFFVLILSYNTSNAQDTALYAAAAQDCETSSEIASPDSSLYIVNPDNANASFIGEIGFNGVTGLAILGNGRLVATAQDDISNNQRRAILIEIDPRTGQGTLIGLIGDETNPNECGRVPDITYDPVTNTLYGVARRCNVGSDNNQFIEINTTTGQGTIIGDTGQDGGGSGVARRDDGTIFWGANPAGLAFLATINPETGLATIITNYDQDFPQLGAFAFEPDTQVLFATNINPEPPLGSLNTVLETVNTANGELTLIGQLPDCTDAIIFAKITRNVPTLSQWGLIAMAAVIGVAGIMFIRRKSLV